MPDDILDGITRFRDRLGMFGRAVSWYQEIGSTNDAALLLAERGGDEGALVGADLQTAGRGRQGRIWSSPRGAGLYVSAILRPPKPVVGLLTLAAGVSIAEGIREASGLTVDLKWPNDAYLGGRKVAGILAEAGTSNGGLNHVVLGLGINVSEASYPAEIAARATSLEREVGRPIDRGLVLASCLSALAARYDELLTDASGVLAAWRSYAARMLGRRVECTVGLRSVVGVAEDIDDAGALIVRAGGETIRVISGEVIWS